MPSSVQAAFSGTAQAFLSSLSSELLLIILAIGTVYIVLGVLYESLVHPITILSTLPSAGVGALLALMLLHVDLTIIGGLLVSQLLTLYTTPVVYLYMDRLRSKRDRTA